MDCSVGRHAGLRMRYGSWDVEQIPSVRRTRGRHGESNDARVGGMPWGSLGNMPQTRLPSVEVAPQELKARRLRQDWSLQDLAIHSGINKAYLSEYENGKRRLSEEQLQSLDRAFAKYTAVGSARPRLEHKGDHFRLVFVDAEGNEYYRPGIAHLRWIEDDGTAYTMFVGNDDG